MNKRRLKELKRFLGTIPEIQFNIDSWIRQYTKGKSCQTACCVGGWAALNPVFAYEGLCLVDRTPSYDTFDGYDALENFFELTEEQAKFIFDPGAYTKKPKIKDVLKRLDILINKKPIDESLTRIFQAQYHTYREPEIGLDDEGYYVKVHSYDESSTLPKNFKNYRVKVSSDE